MPPKPKFTKETIAEVALNIVKEQGVAALTARELGKKLGVSSTPIFTIFENMDEVKCYARKIGLQEFEAYVGDIRNYTPAFKRIGMQMVSYAIHQPEVFKMIYMHEQIECQSFDELIKDLGDMVGICIELIQQDYNLTEEKAKRLFEVMWVYTFGVSSMCAMKVCDFTEEEIEHRLGQVFNGMVMIIKGE